MHQWKTLNQTDRLAGQLLKDQAECRRRFPTLLPHLHLRLHLHQRLHLLLLRIRLWFSEADPVIFDTCSPSPISSFHWLSCRDN